MDVHALDGPSDEQVTAFVRRVLAPNPGPMTLDGTNSYVLRARRVAGAVVVDPGPLARRSPRAPRGSRSGRAGAVTHHHVDHTEAVAEFAG